MITVWRLTHIIGVRSNSRYLLEPPTLPWRFVSPLRSQERIHSFICSFIYLFMAVLGLRFCVRAFSSCGKRGPLFIAVRRPLTIAASLVAEHRLQTHRLSSCGARAQLLHSMWDPPRPGLEPVSPALAGRFSTTAPPGKPRKEFLMLVMFLDIS